MEKFPSDICTAETRTNGDPNILNDPIFAPPKKINFSEIFGSPSPKKNITPKKKRMFLLNNLINIIKSLQFFRKAFR